MENDVLYNRIMNVVHEEYGPPGGEGTKEITITENGTTTEDVRRYAYAEITVNVSGGGGATELASVTLTEAMRSVQLPIANAGDYDFIWAVADVTFPTNDYLYWGVNATGTPAHQWWRFTSAEVYYMISQTKKVDGSDIKCYLTWAGESENGGVKDLNVNISDITFLSFSGYSADMQAGSTIKVYGGKYEI